MTAAKRKATEVRYKKEVRKRTRIPRKARCCRLQNLTKAPSRAGQLLILMNCWFQQPCSFVRFIAKMPLDDN